MKMHHVGIVVDSIERYLARSCGSLQMQPISPVVEDPVQGVRVQFVSTPDDHVSIELIEPSSPDSPVLNALKKGGGLNHICYEVNDITRSLSDARRNGAIIVRGETPATAFQGRPIAFVFYPGMGIVEFVQQA